jgi:hypothetical protein
MRRIQDDLSDGGLNMTYRNFVIVYVCRSIAKSWELPLGPRHYTDTSSAAVLCAEWLATS